MAEPTPPSEAVAAELRQRATLQRAANTAAALDLVAAQYERPRSELRRLLSRRDLEHETAAVLVRFARQEAARLLREGQEPDAGDDALSRATAAIYARLKAERERQLNEEAERAWAEKAARQAQ